VEFIMVLNNVNLFISFLRNILMVLLFYSCLNIYIILGWYLKIIYEVWEEVIINILIMLGYNIHCNLLSNFFFYLGRVLFLRNFLFSLLVLAHLHCSSKIVNLLIKFLIFIILWYQLFECYCWIMFFVFFCCHDYFQ